MTTVTQEEINQFRSALEGNDKALTALNVIEKECDKHLEDAIMLLLARETGEEPTRGVNELVQKCRQVICREEIKDAVANGLIAVAIEPLAIGAGIPPGTATALVILIFKLNIKKFCENSNSTS